MFLLSITSRLYPVLLTRGVLFGFGAGACSCRRLLWYHSTPSGLHCETFGRAEIGDPDWRDVAIRRGLAHLSVTLLWVPSLATATVGH
ncbi:hypothetical protein F5X98DRAFT_356595 [Xylaria grammica]|nr:hypothetical protein F5X98DRAFT_356595 [Xylaria grammica]